MFNSELIQPHHLARKAVIYIRQSTAHQVMSNVESRKLQHAMHERARQLGWEDDCIEVVESDTGVSAQSTAGREGYKHLLSEIAIENVGIVISCESARLSRNCTDWYPLLDICAFRNCLIGDRDGIYDPASPNGRLLLGMKGILSEVELHTLQGRLLAGRQNKARRGELAQGLPAGLLRLDDGRVVKDPDRQVQEAIDLVFASFLRQGSASKAARFLQERGLRLPRRRLNRDTIWHAPTTGVVVSILKNPAYAGAFVFGRTRTLKDPETSGRREERREMKEWSVIVQDRYPAYISWETYERIQGALRANHAQYARNFTPGVPRDGRSLLQGLVYCGECGHKLKVQYKGATQYRCSYFRESGQGPICQFLPADPIDERVTEAFFQALSPAELDLYDRVVGGRRDQEREAAAAQERELQRLRYDVNLARRQYDRVDPDNRLVAGELEQRWEEALQALRDAEQRFERDRQERDKVVPIMLNRETREAFKALGQSLPTLWNQGAIRNVQRKALLRCLIDKVVVHRSPTERDRIHTRIVWRGGAITEVDVPVPVHSDSELSRIAELEAQILELEAKGHTDVEIAEILTERGFRSAQRKAVTDNTVQRIRLRLGRLRRYDRRRPRTVPGSLTVPQAAKALGVTAHRLYRLISRGILSPSQDTEKRLYLFPDNPGTLAELRQAVASPGQASSGSRA